MACWLLAAERRGRLPNLALEEEGARVVPSEENRLFVQSLLTARYRLATLAGQVEETPDQAVDE
jgi:hypothetical protein